MSDPPFATLRAAVRGHAAARPGHPALVCGSRVVTYAQLEERTDRLAGTLHAAGAAGGVPVAHLGPDSEACYELLLACAKTGAVLVPIDPWLAVDEVGHALTDSGARLLFTGAGSLPTARRLARFLDHTVVLGSGEARRWWVGQPAYESTSDDDGRPLVCLYPGGVVRSAGWFASDEAAVTGWHADEIRWAVRGLRAGDTIVIGRAYGERAA